MNDIKLIKRRYMTQSFLLLTALTLIGVLIMKIGKVDHMVTPLIVGLTFALIIELADILVWSRIAQKQADYLPTFFMAVSSVRTLAAIGVMFVFFLVMEKASILVSCLTFMSYYLTILIHHSLFFIAKSKAQSSETK